MKSFLFPLLLLPALANAETLYKCVEGGKTIFQKTECAGVDVQTIEIKHPSAEQMERRRAEQARVAARMEELNKREKEEWNRQAPQRIMAEHNRRMAEIDNRYNQRMQEIDHESWVYKCENGLIPRDNFSDCERHMFDKRFQSPVINR